MTLPNDFISAMYAYYLDGHSLLETGKQFNRSMQSVWQLFHRHNLKLREPYRQIKAQPLKQVDRDAIKTLEFMALELPPGDTFAYRYGVNLVTLNNIRSRLHRNNRGGLYDDKKTLEQCNVRISQEHRGDKYYIVIRKVRG